MNQIIVDDTLKTQLLNADEPCEIVDTAGNKLGCFTPDYEGYECPYSEEELRRAAQEGGGRLLKDILADLEGQR